MSPMPRNPFRGGVRSIARALASCALAASVAAGAQTLGAAAMLGAGALALAPQQAWAEDAGFTITGSTGYAYENGVLTVQDEANLTISTSGQTSHRIVVAENAEATITLNGVNIAAPTEDPQPAIDLESGATLTLVLSDNSTNALTGGAGGNENGVSGIHVPAGTTLIIQGSGSLSVTGGASETGYGGSGIGGNPADKPWEAAEDCGTVVILATGSMQITGGNGSSTADGHDIGGGKGSPDDGDDGQGIRPVPDQANTYEVWGELALPEGVEIPEGAILTGDGSLAEGSKLEQPAPTSAPTISDISQITDTSVTLDAVAGGKTQTHYAWVKGAAGDVTPPVKDSQWDPKLTIPDLMAATAYTFYARYCETDFYKPSPASPGLTVVTAPPPYAVSINYEKETIVFAPQHIEVSPHQGFSSLFHAGESITPHIARSLYVRAKVDDGAQASIKGVTKLEIPLRPNYADGITVVNASSEGVNDGKITGVSANMQYKKADAASWTDCAGSTIDDLTPGTYYVRTKATENSFASLSKKATIGVGEIVSIALPTFDPVYSGYSQPDPKPIEIRNSSDEDARIVSVSCAGVVFKIQPEPSQDLLKIPAHGTNAHYALRPEPGMVDGEYASPITVTYRDANNETHAVTAEAKFTVLPQSTTSDPDDEGPSKAPDSGKAPGASKPALPATGDPAAAIGVAALAGVLATAAGAALARRRNN